MSAAASRIPTQAMKIEKVKEHIGAIATGIDLRVPSTRDAEEALRRRRRKRGPCDSWARASHAGPVASRWRNVRRADGDQNRRYLVDGFPLISVLDNRHKDSKGQPAKVGANATWHTDHTNQELPPKFTMLYAVAVPDKGGATSVCNARAAYEALPDDVKLKIADAKTENTLISSARMKTGNPDIVKAQLEAAKSPTVHPLVRTHPETGTKAVWFHKGKTETVTGMSPEETQDFLQDLTDRITQPQFCYAHEYKRGDLLIIDDRASLHKADSITITASIAACIGCWRVATVPTERLSIFRDQSRSYHSCRQREDSMTKRPMYLQHVMFTSVTSSGRRSGTRTCLASTSTNTGQAGPPF